jgi:hypothetical protein
MIQCFSQHLLNFKETKMNIKIKKNTHLTKNYLIELLNYIKFINNFINNN